MKEKSIGIPQGILLPLVLGAICAYIIYATLTGRPLPLIAGPRAGLIALLIVGMAMCSSGISQVGASGRWASPLAILGYLLGAVILLAFVGTLAGWKLPLIAGETQAIVAIAILMAVKYLIGTASYLFHWL